MSAPSASGMYGLAHVRKPYEGQADAAHGAAPARRTIGVIDFMNASPTGGSAALLPMGRCNFAVYHSPSPHLHRHRRRRQLDGFADELRHIERGELTVQQREQHQHLIRHPHDVLDELRAARILQLGHGGRIAAIA